MIPQQYDLRWLLGILLACENNNYLNQRLFEAICQGSHQLKPVSEGAVPPSLEEQTPVPWDPLVAKAKLTPVCIPVLHLLPGVMGKCNVRSPTDLGIFFPFSMDLGMTRGSNKACFCFAHACELLFSE